MSQSSNKFARQILANQMIQGLGILILLFLTAEQLSIANGKIFSNTPSAMIKELPLLLIIPIFALSAFLVFISTMWFAKSERSIEENAKGYSIIVHTKSVSTIIKYIVLLGAVFLSIITSRGLLMLFDVMVIQDATVVFHVQEGHTILSNWAQVTSLVGGLLIPLLLVYFWKNNKNLSISN